MELEELTKLDELTLELNFRLCLLKNALKNDFENDLEHYMISPFVEQIYQNSNSIREIFSNILYTK